jgi:hypothetical protein
MTAPDDAVPRHTGSGDTASRRVDHWSGGCLIATGLLLLTAAPHPDIYDTTFAAAALETPLWAAMHVALIGATILSLMGLSGLYLPRARRMGRLGAAGYACAVPGLVAAACLFYWEAFLLPVIAVEAPELFAWDGPLVTSWTGVASGALAGLWFVGLVLFGLALWRSRVVPVGPALTLVGTALAFVAFAGPFVPVLGVLSTVAVAGAHGWVGVALWTGAAGHIGAVDQDRRPVPSPAG